MLCCSIVFLFILFAILFNVVVFRPVIMTLNETAVPGSLEILKGVQLLRRAQRPTSGGVIPFVVAVLSRIMTGTRFSSIFSFVLLLL